MNISLTPELARIVAKKVESGLYASASEVVREALRLLAHMDDTRRRSDALNRRIDRGLAELDRGEGIPGAASHRRARRKLRAAARANPRAH